MAFEGIDGSGKSSLAKRLYQRLTEGNMSCAIVATSGAQSGPLVRPEGLAAYVEESLCRLAGLVWPADGAVQHHELGYGYWTGLVGAYYRGLEHAVLPRLRARFDVVIVENWCYKFAAKMVLKGATPAGLTETLPLETCIDAVILVDTPPADAWARGDQFSFVELGGQDGYAVPGRESFIDYQTRVRSRLLDFADENWHRVDNTGGLDEACALVEAILAPMLAERVGR